MSVLRIVANLPAPDPAETATFYRDLLGLDEVMDHGWIITLAASGGMVPQLSIASEGGNDTPCPISRSRLMTSRRFSPAPSMRATKSPIH